MRNYCGSVGTALILAITLLDGCATMSSTRSPGVDLSNLKSIYVIKLAADERGINSVITDELNALGYKATTGREQDRPRVVDAVVTLQLHKYWRVVAENGVGQRILKSFEPFAGYHRG